MARAGLKADDQLVTVNGENVSTPQQVEDALKAAAVGQKIPIDVVRGGKKQTLVWKPEPQELPTAESRPAAGLAGQDEPSGFITAALLGWDNSGKTYLGVTLDEKVADQAIVRAVASGSPAQQARLQAGDRIYSISGIWLKSPQDLARIVEQDRPGMSVYLYIGRESGADKAPSDAPRPPPPRFGRCRRSGPRRCYRRGAPSAPVRPRGDQWIRQHELAGRSALGDQLNQGTADRLGPCPRGADSGYMPMTPEKSAMRHQTCHCGVSLARANPGRDPCRSDSAPDRFRRHGAKPALFGILASLLLGRVGTRNEFAWFFSTSG